MEGEKIKANRNRTIGLEPEEIESLKGSLVRLDSKSDVEDILQKTIYQDQTEAVSFLPDSFVDLLFLDPPYNLNKTFGSRTIREMTPEEYETWFESWFVPLLRLLKNTASVYICGDWRSSGSIFRVVSRYLTVRNRITFEREKGRGAIQNWKNCSEDIWFCTVSNRYTFNPEQVKTRRKVIAPYRDSEGKPKDWIEENGLGYRDTFPSNVWTDITIPFWSMPENTDHPTQKPEKLLAKIILASSNEADVILDPFLGSGTTSVVAKKLNREYVGIESELEYCLLAEKRIRYAAEYSTIQGYEDGVFWERNSSPKLRNR